MYTRKAVTSLFPLFLNFEVMEEKKMAKTCNDCKKEPTGMTKITMSSADWQRNEQRHEKREKRHWILEIILVALLVFSNIAWIIYESQFEVVEESTVIEQENGNGDNNYIGNDGNINYGETKDND